MTNTTPFNYGGRFQGRDLASWASPKAALPAAAGVTALAGLSAILFARDTDTARPIRGSVATVLSDNIEWGFTDIAGLLAAVFVGLLPFLQALRIFTARSIEGLSLWAWLLFTWVMLAAGIQGFVDGDTFLSGVSVSAAAGSVAILLLFRKYGRWSWRAFVFSLLLAASGVLVIRGSQEVDGGLSWVLALIGALPIASVIAFKTVTAILASSSRRGCSQAVHLLGAIGYAFWFVQALQTSNTALAAVSIILSFALLAGLGFMVYLGSISDDGVSAADVFLFRQVKKVPRAIAMHQPVFDKFGSLIDLELLWANDNWQSYRINPVISGARASQHRVRFGELLPYLQKAWDEGRSVQFFRLDKHHDKDLGIYNYSGEIWNAEIEVETVFVRTEFGMIMEWGDDLQAKVNFGSELEAQRHQAEARRRALAAKLAAQSEQTKFHMALHDNILQELFIIQIGLEAGTLSPMSLADAERSRAAVEKVSKDIRSLIEGTKSSGDLLALDDRIAELLDSWALSGDRIPELVFELETGDSTAVERIPNSLARPAFHIAKEAVSNAIKHADADTVSVSLAIRPDGSGRATMELQVSDDGKGIPSENTRRSGLANMADRAAEIGGLLFVEDLRLGPYPGTKVTLTLENVLLDTL